MFLYIKINKLMSTHRTLNLRGDPLKEQLAYNLQILAR